MISPVQVLHDCHLGAGGDAATMPSVSSEAAHIFSAPTGGGMSTMTRRYVMALGLVALLSCGAYVMLTHAIATQESAAAVVNLSGRQRMLSQRAALHAQALAHATTPAQADAARQVLGHCARLLLTTHLALINGDPQQNLPGRPPPEVAAILFTDPAHQLHLKLQQYVARCQEIAAMPPGPPMQQAARDLLPQSQALLASLDSAVVAYQKSSEKDIAELKVLEAAVLGATLLVLALEAVFIFRPMVARVRAEHARVVEAHRKTKAIVDHSYDAMTTLDADGRVITANPAISGLVGYSPEELMGHDLAIQLRLRPAKDAATSQANPAASTQVPSLQDGRATLRARRKDGAVIPVDISVATTVDGLRVVALRESPAELQRYAKELERRNHELDQFAYVAAHDLKAPARAIAHVAGWLEEDLGASASPQALEHLRLLAQRAGRMQALVEALRRYASATSSPPVPEEIDTAALLSEIFAEHNVANTGTLRLPPRLPVLLCSRTRLYQVFANLIGNAVKHGKPGGTVTITWELDAAQPGAIDAALTHGSQALALTHAFTVSDDGPGIPPAHREKVWEIFHTVAPKDAARSLGLGMALVRKIVRENGGDAQVVDDATGCAIRFTWHAPVLPSPNSMPITSAHGIIR